MQSRRDEQAGGGSVMHQPSIAGEYTGRSFLVLLLITVAIVFLKPQDPLRLRARDDEDHLDLPSAYILVLPFIPPA